MGCYFLKAGGSTAESALDSCVTHLSVQYKLLFAVDFTLVVKNTSPQKNFSLHSKTAMSSVP